MSSRNLGDHVGAGPVIVSDRLVQSRRPAGLSTGQLISSQVNRQSPISGQPKSSIENVAQNTTGSRIVDTGNFEISYEIGDVGPSGIGAIEFYVTQNDGMKWWKFGDDLDRRSPFRVKLPGDGTFGFAIRVRSGVGLAADPPQPGDKPTIVVTVDQTPPIVQLYPVQQGQGASLNRIMIRWKAEDENPAEKSISLAYSDAPNGPWTPISDWHQDAGSFLWTVGNDVPASLYIGLSVRDAAGNVRRVVTATPVIVDLTKPSARIVGVKSPTDVDLR